MNQPENELPPCQTNTDRELWREREGDYYADSVSITESGLLCINVGGTVVCKRLAEWFAVQQELAETEALLAGTRVALHESAEEVKFKEGLFLGALAERDKVLEAWNLRLDGLPMVESMLHYRDRMDAALAERDQAREERDERAKELGDAKGQLNFCENTFRAVEEVIGSDEKSAQSLSMRVRAALATARAEGREQGPKELEAENDMLKRCINELAGGAAQGYLAFAKFRNRVSAPPSKPESAE